ncbi:DUF1707 SHOCT-like domain-containing protein [Actinophytocola gossypii]|uniref:DUF1707 domain-containing protein n=1 Tax=Actinophytocola gossypii TaxID=2812003 RepID=A0ABT2JD37_9PSEU|nr:DUF1707 domain-containing protein [Actinophytocola gossypii]MCT2585793.1 DUF1707 domain-containing protein [Actinophytocola gossypii]
MNEPSERKRSNYPVRASDAERERVATLVSDAAGEGRLTLAEAEERMNAIYAATYRYELDRFVADLPEPVERPANPARRFAGMPQRLRVHATVAAVLSVFLIVRWVASGVPFFWPAGPMLLLWGSYFVHAAVVRRGGRGVRQWGPPPWGVER